MRPVLEFSTALKLCITMHGHCSCVFRSEQVGPQILTDHSLCRFFEDYKKVSSLLS